MKILDIIYKNNNKAQITLEGDLCFVIDPVKIYDLKLEKGQEISDETVEKIRDEAKRFMALNKAAASLSRADFSQKGLIKKLSEKGVEKEYAIKAVEFYSKRGYIDDREFAKRLCRYYSGEKYYGARRINEELKKRGISADLAKEITENETNDQQNINIYFNNKFGKVDLSDKKIKNKVYNTLLRAGYCWEDIRRVLNEQDV